MSSRVLRNFYTCWWTALLIFFREPTGKLAIKPATGLFFSFQGNCILCKPLFILGESSTMHCQILPLSNKDVSCKKCYHPTIQPLSLLHLKMSFYEHREVYTCVKAFMGTSVIPRWHKKQVSHRTTCWGLQPNSGGEHHRDQPYLHSRAVWRG